jgi:transposase
MGQENGMPQIKRASFIAIDVHSSFCEGGWVDDTGKERGSFRTPTDIPSLAAAIEKVPRPRRLVIEEGPLADWLCRNLRPLVDEMVSCDPHRNALIAKEGDKSDPIDWRKLAQLYRGGYVKPVHHPEELARSLFKQHVQLYHDRVRHRVSEALKIVWRVRRLGVFIREKDLADSERRVVMNSKLPADVVAREGVATMLTGYDAAARQVTTLKRRLVRMAKADPAVARLTAIPGVGPVRAATFMAFVDTPFRFKTKQKLWKYIGIGLEKRQSGKGHVGLRVPKRCSRVLKNVILGAARSAAASGDNPFAGQYQRWIDNGCSPRIARRNLARSLATVMWGMSKSGVEYDPIKIGRELERI